MLSSKGFLPYLAVLSMLGFLATDMYLPAFGAMQRDFASAPGTISASLSLFLGGFACAQVLWGVLSDRFGRKPILLAGLSLFALSCLAMLWVTNVWLMLALRFVQAVGVCAAAVSWQALVVDRYPQAKANKVFATIMPLVALSPALAPLLGAWLMAHFHWRAIFLALTLVTLVLLFGTLKLASAPRARHDSAPQPGWLTLLATRIYSGNVLIYAACSASFFAWLTGSPFILAAAGLSPADIGLSYIPQTIAFLLGGIWLSRTAEPFSGCAAAAVVADDLQPEHSGPVCGGADDHAAAGGSAAAVLRHGAGQWRDLPDCGVQRPRPVPAGHRQSGRPAESAAAGLMLPRQPDCFRRSAAGAVTYHAGHGGHGDPRLGRFPVAAQRQRTK